MTTLYTHALCEGQSRGREDQKTKIRNLFFCALMAVIMIAVVAMPRAVYADDGGTTVYNETDLKNALDNNSISKITLGGDINLESTLQIPSNRTVTIDLNNNSLNAYKEATISNKGNLTIEGSGSVTNTSYEAIANYGTLTINGGSISSTNKDGIANYGNGTININYGFISSTNGSGVSNTDSGTISIIGGSISSTSGSGVSNTGSGDITIGGGGIMSASSSGISLSTGTVTLIGGEVSSQDVQGVYNNGGTFVMNGGNISAKGSAITTDDTSSSTTINGGTLKGDGISNSNGATTTIKWGVVEGELDNNNSSTMKVYGGAFTRPVSQQYIQGNIVNFYYDSSVYGSSYYVLSSVKDALADAAAYVTVTLDGTETNVYFAARADAEAFAKSNLGSKITYLDVTPVTPSGGGDSTSGVNSGNGADTGDDMNIALYAALAVFALGGAITTAVYRPRRD